MALNLGFGFPGFEEHGSRPAGLTLAHLLDQHWLEEQAATIYDRNPNLVVEIVHPKPCIVKWFGWRSRFHYTISPFIKSRAQISWDMAGKILEAGGRTPEPVYTCTRRQAGWIKENIFITVPVVNHQSLRTWLKNGADEETRAVVILDLAENLAAIHNRGIFHRDLTTGNILLDPDLKTYLIDLNRGECASPTDARRLADLVKIYFGDWREASTRSLLRRFFRHYADCSGRFIQWENIYLTARSKLERQRQRKRRVRRLLRNAK